jgi:hypothetical protein
VSKTRLAQPAYRGDAVALVAARLVDFCQFRILPHATFRARQRSISMYLLYRKIM